jgi:hypothetical protein
MAGKRAAGANKSLGVWIGKQEDPVLTIVESV